MNYSTLILFFAAFVSVVYTQDRDTLDNLCKNILMPAIEAGIYETSKENWNKCIKTIPEERQKMLAECSKIMPMEAKEQVQEICKEITKENEDKFAEVRSCLEKQGKDEKADEAFKKCMVDAQQKD